MKNWSFHVSFPSLTFFLIHKIWVGLAEVLHDCRAFGAASLQCIHLGPGVAHWAHWAHEGIDRMKPASATSVTLCFR